MEFHIALDKACAGLGVVQSALFEVDPAAVADLDTSGLVMRISASLTTAELIAALQQIGWPVTTAQVEQLPSICCGGCGG